MNRALRAVRKGLVFLVGLVLVVIGLALFFLPGHLLVVTAGIAVWASEFAWARRLLVRVREGIAALRRKYRKRREPRAAEQGQREDDAQR